MQRRASTVNCKTDECMQRCHYFKLKASRCVPHVSGAQGVDGNLGEVDAKEVMRKTRTY